MRGPYDSRVGSSLIGDLIAGLLAGLALSGHTVKVKHHETLLQLACEIEVLRNIS